MVEAIGGVVRRVRRIVQAPEQASSVLSRTAAERLLGSDVAKGRSISEIAGEQIQEAVGLAGGHIEREDAVDIFHGLLTAAIATRFPPVVGAVLGAPLVLEEARTHPQRPRIPRALQKILFPGVRKANPHVDVDKMLRGVTRKSTPRRGMAAAVKRGIVKRDRKGRLRKLTPKERKEAERAGLLKPSKRR